MAAAQQAISAGPVRVIVDQHGTGTTPKRAKELGIDPSIIFIRKDGWTLGAPDQLEDVAYKMWQQEWVGFMRYIPADAVLGGPKGEWTSARAIYEYADNVL